MSRCLSSSLAEGCLNALLVFHHSLWCSYAFFIIGQWEFLDFVWLGRAFFGDEFLGFFWVDGLKDQCDLCFVGNFVYFFRREFCVWSIDLYYVFSLVISLDFFSFFIMSSLNLVGAPVCWFSAKCRFFKLLRKLWPIIWFQLD